jgi:hypothetical protein
VEGHRGSTLCRWLQGGEACCRREGWECGGVFDTPMHGGQDFIAEAVGGEFSRNGVEDTVATHGKDAMPTRRLDWFRLGNHHHH